MHIFKKSILTTISMFIMLDLFLLVGTASTTTYPMTVIDETGTAVSISKKPQRLISTAPSNTEILFSLGLGENIVGNTNY